MSEYISNRENIRQQLIELGLGMLQGQHNPQFVGAFANAIEQAVPRDIVYLVDAMVQTSHSIDEIKKAVSKVINLLYLPLQQHQSPVLSGIPFIKAMMDENREMETRMTEIKTIVKSINNKSLSRSELDQLKKDMLIKLNDLGKFDRHYLRKENILFPYLENVWADYRCLQVMWSLHEGMRKSLRHLRQTLQIEPMPLETFNQQVGALFFSVYPLIYREEKILFPVAAEEIQNADWQSMHQQSLDIGFAWIDAPESINRYSNCEKVTDGARPDKIDLETGSLEVKQIIQAFNHLPVDITLVNEHDEVCYFSNSKNRHFPRSKAIIGRKVQNCHPPESLHTVNQIINAFRNGEKDEAAFWIQMKGQFILIQYLAVRDENHVYKGVLEVSQDITQIKSLEGERRLLDW